MALGIAIALGTLTLGAVVLLDARRDAWSQAARASQNLLLSLERDIARNVAVFDLSLQGVTEALREPGIDGASPRLRHQALFDRAASAEDLGSILVLDQAGDVLEDSTGTTPHRLNFADRDYFRVHRDRADVGLYVSRPYRSRLRDGDLSISISRRLPTEDGHFGGVVSGSLRLAFFRRLFEKLDVGPHGTITLFRADGRVILRYPFREADVDRDLGQADTFRHFAASYEGQYTGKGAIDGVERLFSFRHVADMPLILSVSRGVDDVYAPWRHKALTIGAALAALCAATVALCILFRREVLRRTAAQEEAKALAAELAVMASTDGLTGLTNRRAFTAELDREWKRSIRGGNPTSLLILDVDHFKAFNDTYGHQGGDRALQAVATCLAGSVRRPGDLVARHGGEEFVALLPETDEAGALFIAERIRDAVERLAVTHAGSPHGRLTVSIGAATARPGIGDSQDDLLRRADAALYGAKREGRNRIGRPEEALAVISGGPDPADLIPRVA